ncbi:MAG: class I SAM-dependent methyltransferase [Acidimicrobiales bacterium]
MADGFDTAFGALTVEAWAAFVTRTCKSVELGGGDSLFDVGCGSGAFLYVPHQQGVAVGGADFSGSLVEIARRAMPDGDFSECEANQIQVAPAFDVVMSCFAFSYFSSLEYAHVVIERMCTKATRAVGILDIPDAALADAAMEHRIAALGGPEAYAERYEGLGHQVYGRDWVASVLKDVGLVDVAIESQDIDGYDNGQFRFNAFGWLP